MEGRHAPIVCRLEGADARQSLCAPDRELLDKFRDPFLVERSSDAQQVGAFGKSSALPNKRFGSQE